MNTKKHLATIIVLGTLITAFTAPRTEAETFTLSPEEKTRIEAIRACNETLSACDKALNRAKKVIQDKNDIMKLQATQIDELANQNAELQSERDSLLRSPVVWFLIGTIVGGLTYGVIQGSH